VETPGPTLLKPLSIRRPKKLLNTLCSYAAELASVEAKRYEDSPYLGLWLIQLCGRVFDAILDRIGHIEDLTYHTSEDSMRSAIRESLEEIKDRRLRGVSHLPKPLTTSTTKKPVITKDERRELINNFISEVSVAATRRITRTDIWKAAGCRDATSFERFQRNDRVSKSASEAFSRVLKMTPEKFIQVLNRKRDSK
jgi:hypothetical protein